tara:strand:- start:324 stop:749 length:426 start_codon:yes stop_codon:yes gene_type:complete
MAFKMRGKSPMAKALVGKQHALPAELKAEIEASPMKDRGERIKGKKGGNTASVTRRVDGEAGYAADNKAANLARRSVNASARGNTGKAAKLKGKAEKQDARAMANLSSAEKAKKRQELQDHNAKVKAKKSGGKNPTIKASF